MSSKVVRVFAWISISLTLVLVLLGFIQVPAVQSLVSIALFFLALPLLLLTGVLWLVNRISHRKAQSGPPADETQR